MVENAPVYVGTAGRVSGWEGREEEETVVEGGQGTLGSRQGEKT